MTCRSGIVAGMTYVWPLAVTTFMGSRCAAVEGENRTVVRPSAFETSTR